MQHQGLVATKPGLSIQGFFIIIIIIVSGFPPKKKILSPNKGNPYYLPLCINPSGFNCHKTVGAHLPIQKKWLCSE